MSFQQVLQKIRMQRWDGRVALVTGASSGIGAAVATSLVKHGMKVVGCARNIDRIKVMQCNGWSFTVEFYSDN